MSYAWHSTDILCGCFFQVEYDRYYLPQVDISAHTTIIGTSSRTVLRQTFENKSKDKIDELKYVFPLYDGVSVVGFRCTIGSRVIEGVVQERNQAKATYKAATDRGDMAGLLEESLSAGDVFTTRIGNVPAGEKVFVDITYLGELEHNAQIDGLRFTIPTQVAPRYGSMQFGDSASSNVQGGEISVTIDIEMPTASAIKSVQSPSHPIAVSVGHTSKAPNADPSFEKATASLTLNSTSLETDFVLHVVATNLGEPTALLETHSTIPHQRALMTTLVPKFALPSEKPEVVFICDRSGSMSGHIGSLISALTLFLKSLPVGVKFNICSFGTDFKFLWKQSKSYTQATLDEASRHVAAFKANFGGTEMYNPILETFKRRFTDMNLEVFVITDGEIWAQEELFAMMNEQIEKAKGAIRVFSLGIGSGASTSLVNGIARGGGGFAQYVHDGEKMDVAILRMLRASLFPHITDYSLEIKYGKCEESDDDFELVEKVNSSLLIGDNETAAKTRRSPSKRIISLFQRDLKDDSPPKSEAAPLPALPAPRYLQTPGVIPPLFPFSRTTVYVLLSDTCPSSAPVAVILRATSAAGPLELEIPVTVLREPGMTIHQLAARREMKELEEGRGWVSLAKVGPVALKDKYPGRYSDMVEREAVRIGTKFQVSGKWCSFVAVEKGNNGDEMVVDIPPEYNESNIEDHMDMSKGSMSASPYGIPLQAPPPAPMQMQAQNVSRHGGSGSSYGSAANSRAHVSKRSAMPQRSKGGAMPKKSMGGAKPMAAPSGAVRHISAMLTKSTGGAAPGSMREAPSYAPSAPPAAPCPQAVALDTNPGGVTLIAQTRGRGQDNTGAFERLAYSPLDDFSYAERRSAPADTSGGERNPVMALMFLINEQLFEGNWRWTPTLEYALGIKAEEAMAAAPGFSAEMVATACAVALLNAKLAQAKEKWVMIEEKAETWLHAQGGDVEALKKAVRTLF
ncbi:hypothetical protein CC85DRAFT_269920 [Cutaneotrichosporon oleaginosum]|uniref:VIT-domain-containing protein n=1 Tax=Cutaneotrichosporon oleaginosum TaxID=879819 RepID=A0A0J0XV56_9TREE|nr:uncharacterized protein CC85DRAFT_269920 [Cutaneotrichosporon oleaginosum]KLT44947.1 hypothetical protein CC85DRAFT_269920 [Cutaneotrichosporon oleaginosum]TXT09636.1 hypothetical protein COLE_03570 [Cutaneotrichosporon oleaginosum]